MIRDVDKGYKALVKKVFGFHKPIIKIGVFTNEIHEGTQLTVLDIAAIHEFGLGVPERSFLRAYVDENEPRLREMVRAILPAVLKGKYTKEQVVELLAQKIVSEIQQRIVQRIPPPLAPETIARKGSDVPLIDTGQLRSSITYKIEYHQ